MCVVGERVDVEWVDYVNTGRMRGEKILLMLFSMCRYNKMAAMKTVL